MTSTVPEVVLAHAVDGIPQASDFRVIERPLPPRPPAGMLHVRLQWLGLDPYVSQRIRGRHMGEPAPAPGERLPGESVALVLASADPDFAAGDHVVGHAGWAAEAIVPAATMRRVDPKQGLAEHLGILGMPGLTAWAGMTQLANVEAGDIVCVDAAAGVVGGTAGQLAKLAGATVVGIAGGSEKTRIVTERYGFDTAIDYHGENWPDALPADIGVHFENVGQRVLDAVLPRLRPYGQIVLCGLAQHYADGSVAQLPVGRIIGKRATVRGLVVYDFFPRLDEWVQRAATLVREGRLVEVRDVATGMDAIPAQLERVARGAAVGRAVVDLGTN